MSASSVESSVTPVSAHYTDAPKDLDYHSVPANGKVAMVTVRGGRVAVRCSRRETFGV